MSEKFDKLLQTVAALRNPDTGCPWDLKQNHESLLPFLLEEASEFAQEVYNNEPTKMKDELGDLLLQVLLHTQIASEGNQFSMDDVVENLDQKLIRRHPHVFANPENKEYSVEEIKENWQQIKAEEKSDQDKKEKFFDKNDNTFPALAAAQRIGKKTSKINFDWESPSQVLYKVEEEWQELKEEIYGQKTESNPFIEEEMGDLLFSIVQLARHLKIDAEQCLYKANKKFIDRFDQVEDEVIAQGRKLGEINQDELEIIWQNVKKKNK